MLIALVLFLSSQATSAEAHHLFFKTQSKAFGPNGVMLSRWGWYPEHCILVPVPCFAPTQPETTAKTYVVRELLTRHPNVGVPQPRIEDLGFVAGSVAETLFDKVSWEVGIYGAGGWRIDILVDDPDVAVDPTILEAKRWASVTTTPTEVDKQLSNPDPPPGEELGYVEKAARDVGLLVRRNSELNADKWLTPYIDDTLSLSCVWADEDPIAHPGNIYYAPLLETPPSVQQRCATEALVRAVVTTAFKKALEVVAKALGRPLITPLYQEADYWTCRGKYDVTVSKASVAQTLVMEWGDGSSSQYPVPASSGPTDLVAVIEMSHIFREDVTAI